jgi:hypothetical protein
MAGKFGIERYGLTTGAILSPVGLHTPNTYPSANASKPSMPQRIEKAV